MLAVLLAPNNEPLVCGVAVEPLPKLKEGLGAEGVAAVISPLREEEYKELTRAEQRRRLAGLRRLRCACR